MPTVYGDIATQPSESIVRPFICDTDTTDMRGVPVKAVSGNLLSPIVALDDKPFGVIVKGAKAGDPVAVAPCSSSQGGTFAVRVRKGIQPRKILGKPLSPRYIQIEGYGLITVFDYAYSAEIVNQDRYMCAFALDNVQLHDIDQPVDPPGYCLIEAALFSPTFIPQPIP